MSLFGGIIDSVAGFMGHQAEKKQTKNIIRDYNSAQEGSINAFTGARDAQLGYYQPYAEGGQQAFGNALNMQTPGFAYSPSDPSYAWRLGEGMNALTRQQSAAGGLQSGGAQKAAMRYGQGLASTEFGADFARNNQLAGYGMQAAQGQSQAQSGYASGISNALFAGANGRKSAYTDRGKAIADQWGAGADFVSTVGHAFGF